MLRANPNRRTSSLRNSRYAEVMQTNMGSATEKDVEVMSEHTYIAACFLVNCALSRTRNCHLPHVTSGSTPFHRFCVRGGNIVVLNFSLTWELGLLSSVRPEYRQQSAPSSPKRHTETCWLNTGPWKYSVSFCYVNERVFSVGWACALHPVPKILSAVWICKLEKMLAPVWSYLGVILFLVFKECSSFCTLLLPVFQLVRIAGGNVILPVFLLLFYWDFLLWHFLLQFFFISFSWLWLLSPCKIQADARRV